ncbi:hypothetical protein D3C71_1427310 [compost metagenome]
MRLNGAAGQAQCHVVGGQRAPCRRAGSIVVRGYCRYVGTDHARVRAITEQVVSRDALGGHLRILQRDSRTDHRIGAIGGRSGCSHRHVRCVNRAGVCEQAVTAGARCGDGRAVDRGVRADGAHPIGNVASRGNRAARDHYLAAHAIQCVGKRSIGAIGASAIPIRIATCRDGDVIERNLTPEGIDARCTHAFCEDVGLRQRHTAVVAGDSAVGANGKTADVGVASGGANAQPSGRGR